MISWQERKPFRILSVSVRNLHDDVFSIMIRSSSISHAVSPSHTHIHTYTYTHTHTHTSFPLVLIEMVIKRHKTTFQFVYNVYILRLLQSGFRDRYSRGRHTIQLSRAADEPNYEGKLLVISRTEREREREREQNVASVL